MFGRGRDVAGESGGIRRRSIAHKDAAFRRGAGRLQAIPHPRNRCDEAWHGSCLLRSAKIYGWRLGATGPGHGIQLSSGRLLVPVWLALGTAGNGHGPSVNATVYSDDHGATWHRGEIAVPDTPEFPSANETAAVQLADGRVMLN